MRLFDPYPQRVFGFGKAENTKPPFNFEDISMSDLQVRYAHPFGIFLCSESLTGLPRLVTVANVGLDSGRSKEGLSEGSIRTTV